MEKSSIHTGAIFWQQCAGNKKERKSPVKQSYETIQGTVYSRYSVTIRVALCITTFKLCKKHSRSHQLCHKPNTSLSTHLIMGVSQHCRRKWKTWQICIHVMSGVQIICKAINWMSFYIWSLCCPITPTHWGSYWWLSYLQLFQEIQWLTCRGHEQNEQDKHLWRLW